MDSEIRSALEIAMEKVGKLGEATEEERLRWKYTPEGEKLAVKYLKQGLNLVAELGRYEEKARKHVSAGIGEVLVRNINLPKNEAARKTNKKAMDGLKIIKDDKVAVENIYSQMRRIFDHYVEPGERQRKQAYASLKAEFEAKFQQALQQQLGTFVGFKIDVESQPQFQEEWRKLQAQLDSPYRQHLDEFKKELLAIN